MVIITVYLDIVTKLTLHAFLHNKQDSPRKTNHNIIFQN